MNELSAQPRAAAALAGAVASFPLVQVLGLLGRTGQTGELQVVGRGIDRTVWLDRGKLVETGGGGESALLELACLDEGWFNFWSVPAPRRGARRPLESVLEELAPQLEEWQSLVTACPFDATVRMSANPPAAAVQIRADQWNVLALVASGGKVGEVVAASGEPPMETLRTLRELAGAQLVEVVPSGVAQLLRPAPLQPASTGAGEPALSGIPAHVRSEVPAAETSPSQVPEAETEAAGAATKPEAAVPATETEAAETEGAQAEAAGAEQVSQEPAATEREEQVARGPAGPAVEPQPARSSRQAAPSGAASAQAAPSEAARASDDAAAHRPANDAATAESDVGDPTVELQAVGTLATSVMPPPISGDPWSSEPNRRRPRRFG